MAKSFIHHQSLIIGGDLNFSIGAAESWGPRAHPNSSDFLSNLLHDNGLIDVNPIKLMAA